MLLLTTHVPMVEEDFEKVKLDAPWTRKTKIRRAEFLAAGEACKAIFWPNAGFRERTIHSSGLLIAGISSSTVTHHKKRREKINGHSVICFILQLYCPTEIWKFRLVSLGKASCDSHTTQPTVHAGCFNISIIHQTLTWTTGSLMCAQMLMHMVAHRDVWTSWESLHWKLTLGGKILCHTRG